jgi:hypothetical protein
MMQPPPGGNAADAGAGAPINPLANLLGGFGGGAGAQGNPFAQLLQGLNPPQGVQMPQGVQRNNQQQNT